MAFYDFQCMQCGIVEELSLPMASDKKKMAPKCACTGKKVRMERVLTAPSVIINGRNITVGDMIADGKVQKRPPEWFDEQSKKENKRKKKYDFEK